MNNDDYDNGGATPERRLLIEWERRTRLNLRSHNLAERHFDRLNTATGLVSFVGLATKGR